VGLTTLLPSMSRLSGHCGILNISQPYRPPRPVKGIALLFYFTYLYIHSLSITCVLTNTLPRAHTKNDV
jgi:hypothetical protein